MENNMFDVVVFDMDGVITRTALVHGKAWKACFDEYLRLREKRDNEPFREFTHENDYLPYVDGKPRYEGVKSFLGSRGIKIPYGEPSDGPDKETACGLGNRKNEIFVEILERDGVGVYESTIELIKELNAAGIKTGVASSSKNCELILKKAGVQGLFGSRVDGVISARLSLKGKPEGDIFVRAARELGAEPARSVVVEDAVSGVQAGRNGGFGMVIGVARENNTDDLLSNGADVAVKDLEEIGVDCIRKWFMREPRPLFACWSDAAGAPYDGRTCRDTCGIGGVLNPVYTRTADKAFFSGKEPVFFLDYDGTLTPIVDRPDMAVVSGDMKATVEALAKRYKVAVVSGRFREDVEGLLGVKGIFYAGSHGLDISGPGFSMVEKRAREAVPAVDELIRVFKDRLGGIEGLIVEEKKFSVAVHYRLVDEGAHLARIREVVYAEAAKYPTMKVMDGKKVFEVLPDIDWDKGKAIRWIMNALDIPWNGVSVIYIGDDVTDEYAFRSIRTRGTGILVSTESRPSCSDFKVGTPEDVKVLFRKVLEDV
ncbi:MAG: trehalose-phosphatase [Candidatus Omnitrophica bacterium]|nr:trehalose-phosphatase [Candidatus Omnitrophota bacterium]MDD5487810.1 trehalose-phosphatase [Candidatus Omnitrophota bacterium]